jgi:uncharacterized membrane protein YdjX (TVP38/TMEM64 family)
MARRLTKLLGPKGIVILVYGIIILVLVWLWLTLGIESLRLWLLQAGPWAFAMFLLLYVGLSLAFLPVVWLNLIAGALFGPVLGAALIMTGVLLAASASFLISRYFVDTAWLQARLSEHFGLIQKMISSRNAWKTVLLLRLSNAVPFAVINYLSGAMELRFPGYLLVTFLGSLPGTLIYSGLGALLYEVLRRLS